MKKQLVIIGVILLFLFLICAPTSSAEIKLCSNKSIDSLLSDKLGNNKFTPKHFLIWKIKGTIRDLEFSDYDPDQIIYHFNTTRVVSTGFAIYYLMPFVPIPIFSREVSINEEWWLVWERDVQYNKEIITENYIDFFSIHWGELYPSELN